MLYVVCLLLKKTFLVAVIPNRIVKDNVVFQRTKSKYNVDLIGVIVELGGELNGFNYNNPNTMKEIY
jgi:hypothetical protein